MPAQAFEHRMELRIILPHGVLVEEHAVTRLVADTGAGTVGILPRRLDFIASLVPVILAFSPEGGEVVYVALDQGIMVKAGFLVSVVARNGTLGSDLDELEARVEKDFVTRDPEERRLHEAEAVLEKGFIRALTDGYGA